MITLQASLDTLYYKDTGTIGKLVFQRSSDFCTYMLWFTDPVSDLHEDEDYGYVTANVVEML